MCCTSVILYVNVRWIASTACMSFAFHGFQSGLQYFSRGMTRDFKRSMLEFKHYTQYYVNFCICEYGLYSILCFIFDAIINNCKKWLQAEKKTGRKECTLKRLHAEKNVSRKECKQKRMQAENNPTPWKGRPFKLHSRDVHWFLLSQSNSQTFWLFINTIKG